MTQPGTNVIDQIVPTRVGAVIFRAKSLVLKGRRFVEDTFVNRVRSFKRSPPSHPGAPVIAESTTGLWTETDPAERFLVAGKIQNLRLAIAELDGVEVPAGEVFSFWRQVGRTSRMRGFVTGREIREGCIIPNIGGGLCQLSNSLYDAALKANFEIVERHAHTRVIPGSLAEQGRDATVFWNYVDLRFRSSAKFYIEAKMDSDDLRVRFLGERPKPATLHQISRTAIHSGEMGSCATCGSEDCFRVIKPSADLDFGCTAWLVDEFSPEFDTYINNRRARHDTLYIPVDGRRFRRANYAWSTGGFAKVRQSPSVMLRRSYRSRKLASQGAARQQNLLAMNERLAKSYADKLTFDSLHVVVAQDLLPYLWRGGHLGGRTFDVLMTALPMDELQKRLDLAYSLHPESTTLADFRADQRLIEDETAALAAARRIVTPHTDIAKLFGERSELLDWVMPDRAPMARPTNNKPLIVYPASTVGRKGCYELREAIRGLDVTLMPMGAVIEKPDFWSGFETVPAAADWLLSADLVVLPAFVEHRPRRLIAAAAGDIPVIASIACGVEGLAGVETIETGNVEALAAGILNALNQKAG